MNVFSVPSFGIGWIIAIVLIIAVSLTIEIIRNRNNEIDDINDSLEERILLRVSLPSNNENDAKVAKDLLSSLHGVVGQRQKSLGYFSLEIVSTSFGIQLYIVSPIRYKKFVEDQIYAYYPYAEVKEVPDYVMGLSSVEMENIGVKAAVYELELKKDFIFPLKTYSEFDTDPLSSMLSSLSKMDEFDMMACQILIRPIGDWWQKMGRDYIANLNKGIDPRGKHGFLRSIFKVVSKIYDGIFSIKELKLKPLVVIDKTREDEMRRISSKVTSLGYQFKIRILSSSKDEEKIYQNAEDFISSLHKFDNFDLNSFKVHSSKKKDKEALSELITQYKLRFLDVDTTDILSTGEIASIFHFPSINTNISNVIWLAAKKAEPPLNLPLEDCIYFGKTNYRDQEKKFGIKQVDRRRHMYIVGKTGTGKTTMLKNMIMQDIENGEGVGVIDPHGDLIDNLLKSIDSKRMDDIVLIDPSDVNFPVSINVFDIANINQKDFVASSILNIFKKYFDSWGPRLEYILQNVILTLLSVEGSSMLGILRILTDYQYRRLILSNISDPIILRFWNEEYAYLERNSRLITEIISPIQNKVGRFLSSETIRNIVGQEKNSIDFDDILNNKKILLCSLSQGKIGEDASSLIGSLILTLVQSSIMARSNLVEEQRNDFYLYVDEFQNFATPSFIKLLSEARKYRLNLILAHQYLSQLEEPLKDAIFGNIGTVINFLLGANDAKEIEKEYYPIFNFSDITNLDKYQFYIKETIDAVSSKPFSADSLNEEFVDIGNETKIRESSREKYTLPKEAVEDGIRNWSKSLPNIYEIYSTKKRKNSVDEKIPLNLEN